MPKCMVEPKKGKSFEKKLVECSGGMKVGGGTGRFLDTYQVKVVRGGKW